MRKLPYNPKSVSFPSWRICARSQLRTTLINNYLLVRVGLGGGERTKDFPESGNLSLAALLPPLLSSSCLRLLRSRSPPPHSPLSPPPPSPRPLSSEVSGILQGRLMLFINFLCPGRIADHLDETDAFTILFHSLLRKCVPELLTDKHVHSFCLSFLFTSKYLAIFPVSSFLRILSPDSNERQITDAIGELVGW